MYRLGLIALATCLLVPIAWGGEVSREDFDNLKAELEVLRARAAAKQAPPTPTAGPIGRTEALLDNKYGPNAKVTAKTGRLTLSGLLQVWSYSIQNDNVDYVADEMQTNELFDNDGYRIRRAEMKFSLDLTEDITAVIMIDPTGGDEANTFPGVPSNQGVVGKGFISGGSTTTLEELQEILSSHFGLGSSGYDNYYRSSSERPIARSARSRLHQGFVRTNRVLQDAYINYHSPLIPHHDFTIGQFKAPSGEEAYRNSGQLDFVERAMINQFGNQRDLGIMVHGWWWDERFQYWIGGFNTAGSFQNTFASLQNRSDDNDAKDIAWRLQLRPLWRHEDYGSLEIGYARQDGVHGESGNGYAFVNFSFAPTVDGLSLQESHANRQYAWAWYRPGGPVRGWWLRGEWSTITDRPLPGLGATRLIQLQPRVFKRDGWYFSTGYRLSKSVWSDALRDNDNVLLKLLHGAEFAYRYETFGNLLVEDAVYQIDVDPDPSPFRETFMATRTDVFKSSVHTIGLNYYWKGYNMRTQVNYMFVKESDGHEVSTNYSLAPNGKRIREVRNNVFLISQQVQW